MTDEEWRPVVNWEGYYEVSNLGRVRSQARFFFRKGHKISVRERLMKLNPLTKRSGHIMVGLHRDGVSETRYVHRLVCEAFHGPAPEGKPLVLHWDDDPSNNRAGNLRWGDAAENMEDQLRNKKSRSEPLTHCPRDHPYDEENTYINPRTKTRICRECRRSSQRARRKEG